MAVQVNDTVNVLCELYRIVVVLVVVAVIYN